MITKKRVELYMQRRARLHDTQEDIESFEDFDEDMDFTLDGTEGEFEYTATKEEITEAFASKKVDDEEKEQVEVDYTNIVLPAVELPSGVDSGAFEQWKKTKGKEVTLNSMPKDELRAKVAEEKNLPSMRPMDEFNFKCNGMTPVDPVAKAPEASAVPVFAQNFQPSNSSLEDSLVGSDLVSAKDLTLNELKAVVQLALTFKRLRAKGLPTPSLLENKVVSLLFEEPSTRTRCSFEAAAARLGAKSILVDSGPSSSAAKGESVSDSARVLSSYSDGIVVRGKKDGIMGSLVNVTSCPLINAGDGSGEHPTQALLDLVTMAEARPDLMDPSRTDPIKIVLIGDIKNGRTVHSLALLLAKLTNIEATFVAPADLQAQSRFITQLENAGLPTRTITGLDVECGRADFWYVTRLQTERIQVEACAKPYIQISLKTLVEFQAKPSLKIMHPLPRVNELSPEIDHTSHQLYFTQAENASTMNIFA